MSNQFENKNWIHELTRIRNLENHPLINQKDRQTFDIFFVRFLDYFKSKLEDIFENFENETNIQIHKEKTVSIILTTMQSELYCVGIRTLVYEINEKRLIKLLEGQTPEERYEYYNNQFIDNERFVDLTHKYPVLIYLFEQMIKNRLNLIREAITRLSRDHQQIADQFCLDFKEIKQIQISSGDTHNEGRKVLIFQTEKGKVIYKPHSLSTDKMFNELIQFINDKGKLKHGIHYVNSVDKVDYGWQEYVEPKSCRNEKEVSVYYFRLGVNLALLHAIGATDIHFENVISSGENPFIIDLETLVENKTFEMELDGSLVQEFNGEINESVLGTAVLPLNFKNSIFDFDMSAMSNFEEQKSDFWSMYVVQNNFTDEIKLEKMPGMIGKSSNFVMMSEKKVEPYEYIENIIEGFEQGYLLILQHKEDWAAFINDYCVNHEVIVRQVLKPTSIYAKFLEASTHPSYLKSMKDRVDLLTKLKTKKDRKSKMLLAQRDSEISALTRHDIPYFTTTMTLTDIKCNNKVSIPNFFKTTLLTIILKRLDRISTKDLEKQLYYIRLSLSTLVNNNWLKDSNDRFPTLNRNISYFKQSHHYVDCAKEIGDLLVQKAIWNRDKTVCTWLVQLIDNERLKLGALNYFLYEGGGVILFLFALAKETNDEKYYDIAQAALKGIEGQKRIIEESSLLSAFNGIGSLIYIYYNLYRMNQDLEAYSNYRNCIKELAEYDFSQDCEIDYVTGLSGLITMLLNIYEIEQDKKLLDICGNMGKYFFDRLVHRQEIKLAGMSHGFSGAALALTKLSVHLKEGKYVSLAHKFIQQENEYYNHQKQNWRDLREGEGDSDPVFWCHGSPGIALARALLLPYHDEHLMPVLELDVTRGLEKLWADGFSEKLDHSLCHGIFGNIDILITIGKILHNNKYIEIARAEARKTMERIRKKRVICGLNNAFDLLSFMVGLTGMGYTFLRLNNMQLPSVLSLEVYH